MSEEYDYRDKTCFNPLVLKDGTVTLKIGGLYNVFVRDEINQPYKKSKTEFFNRNS